MDPLFIDDQSPGDAPSLAAYIGHHDGQRVNCGHGGLGMVRDVAVELGLLERDAQAQDNVRIYK